MTNGQDLELDEELTGVNESQAILNAFDMQARSTGQWGASLHKITVSNSPTKRSKVVLASLIKGEE